MARISARWRVNTFSIASDISPTVALARAALTQRSSRLAFPAAPSVSARKRRLRLGLVALAAQALELGDLLLAHRLVVDLEQVDLGVVLDARTC